MATCRANYHNVVRSIRDLLPLPLLPPQLARLPSRGEPTFSQPEVANAKAARGERLRHHQNVHWGTEPSPPPAIILTNSFFAPSTKRCGRQNNMQAWLPSIHHTRRKNVANPKQASDSSVFFGSLATTFPKETILKTLTALSKFPDLPSAKPLHHYRRRPLL